MKAKLHIILPALLIVLSRFVAAAPLETAFTFQGRLTEGGLPARGSYDFQFTLFDAPTNGTPQGAVSTAEDVAVSEGLFTVALDFGADVFGGKACWLEIALRPGTNAGGYIPLSPRQPLTASPYALYASKADVAAAAGVANIAAADAVNTAALQDAAVTAQKIASNQIVRSLNGLKDQVTLAAGANLTITTNANTLTLSSPVWSLRGNSGTTPGAQFLGTTDDQPLQLRVGGQHALRLEPSGTNTPNVIGGAGANRIAPGVRGAVIGGGGGLETWGEWASNWVSGDFGTIGGGEANNVEGTRGTIGGGGWNRIGSNAYSAAIGGGIYNSIEPNAGDAVIGGGWRNLIQSNALSATLAGGLGNTIQPGAWEATISGGRANTIGTNASRSAIGGGEYNTILPGATNATIPGGSSNVVGALQSFAAGRQAKALHTGSFVWADAAGLDLSSTASNQFLVRASGGVGIGTNQPAAALHVAGTVRATAFEGGGSNLTGLSAAHLTSGVLPDRVLSTNVVLQGSSASLWNVSAYQFSGAGAGLSNLNSASLRGPLTVSPLWNASHIGNGGYALSVAVAGHYAYVANDLDGLRIFDVSNPASPVDVGHVYQGGLAKQVVVAGNYAYLASRLDGLRTYDISNPTNPVYRSYSDVCHDAECLTVAGDYLYLGETYGGFFIYDISSPSYPRLVFSTMVGSGIDTLVNIAVAGSYAFLADLTQALWIYDVSNPSNAVPAGHIYVGAPVWDVAVTGNYAYLATSSSRGSDKGGLYIYDVSALPDPVKVAHLTNSICSSVDVWAVALAGDLAYVSDSCSSVHIYSISNRTNPVSLGQSEPWPGSDLTVVGNYAYLAARSSGLRIFDISNLASPARVGGTENLHTARDVAVTGTYAYLANDDDGLRIFDVSNPANPVNVGHVTNSPGGRAFGVAAADRYVYVASGSDGLRVYNVANPGNPDLVAHRTNGWVYDRFASKVEIADHHLYLANGRDGLRVYDVSSPANPVNISRVIPTNYFEIVAVAVAGNHAYLADSLRGVLVYDVANPTNPIYRGAITFSGACGVVDVAAAGDYVYLAAEYCGFQIYSVTNPANPVVLSYTGRYDPSLGYAQGVAVAGNYAYVVNYNGLHIYDITNPTLPLDAGKISNVSSVYDAGQVAVQGHSVYVANGIDGLRIHELGTARAPYFQGDGSLLTALDAGHITSGTLSDEQLSGNVALLNTSPTFAGTVTASGFTGNGAALTGLNAANITSGTLSDARLSGNVALRNSANTFSGHQIVSSGSVGIGTATPVEKLSVYGYDATIRIHNSNGNVGGFIGDSYYTIQFGMFNPTTNQTNGVLLPGAKRSFFGFNADGKVGTLTNAFPTPAFRNVIDDGRGRMGIGTNAPAYPVHVGNGAYCSTGGSWTSASDRNAKENFKPIQPRAVLDKVAALPLTEWNYKVEGRAVRHLGPTAQDFHAAFGLGDSDRAIGSVDAEGVALAAIQGLQQIVQEKESRIAVLEKQNQSLESRLAALEKRLETLAKSHLATQP